MSGRSADAGEAVTNQPSAIALDLPHVVGPGGHHAGVGLDSCYLQFRGDTKPSHLEPHRSRARGMLGLKCWAYMKVGPRQVGACRAVGNYYGPGGQVAGQGWPRPELLCCCFG